MATARLSSSASRGRSGYTGVLLHRRTLGDNASRVSAHSSVLAQGRASQSSPPRHGKQQQHDLSLPFPFLEPGARLPSSLKSAPFAGGCIVLVDKPQGWTSFDVCACVRNRFRRAYGVAKVGHTGTLDPMATGLLVLCVGRATKAVDSLTGAPKRYEGVLRLGEETSSQDADTDVTALRPWRQLTRGVLRAQAASMLGDLKQCPPMYSAVKVGGTRLYQLARQGKVIERRARDVRVDEFDLFFDVCSDGEDEEKSSGTSPSSSSSPPENDDDMNFHDSVGADAGFGFGSSSSSAPGESSKNIIRMLAGLRVGVRQPEIATALAQFLGRLPANELRLVQPRRDGLLSTSKG